MASLDEIFYREFNQMMYQLKGMSQAIGLYDIPLPSDKSSMFMVDKHSIVAISGIEDEYFSGLNNTECMLWSGGTLSRRKFDYKGEFIKNKDGKYVLEQVTLPHDCVAVLSDKKLGVPTKYKAKESFIYVDFIAKKDDKRVVKYIYIVPKKYCYKVNQTALVLSWNKLRVYYQGIGLSLMNGSTLYVYIIPYKPSSVQHNYRVLCTKTSDNYSEELSLLRDYWVSKSVMFNPNICVLMDVVKGRNNMAVEVYNGVLDIYERFDSSRSMDKDADELYQEESDDNYVL